jgi:four helix bundle protein
MKKKPRNGRIAEEPERSFRAERNHGTSNIQRPTSNVQGRRENRTTSTDRHFDLQDRLLEYAVRILRLVDALPRTRAGRHVSDQLLRCGTSPLANHREVQGAESRKDFIHKLRICLKELRESRRWLRLIHRAPLIAPGKVQPLLSESDELIKIFSASIRTAEGNRG